MLAQKVSGTAVGIWLLIPELLRLGAWDILKAWTGGNDLELEPRVALQLVNESAICINRVRKKNSLGHQGFQLANGMGRLVTDEQVHLLLNAHSIEQSREMMINLGIQRKLSGHYNQEVIAIDPHRILSTSQRIMAKKRKNPDAPSQKMLQTFFSLCTQTGQPIMATMSSTGLPTSKATCELLDATHQILKSKALVVADKEHFTKEIINHANKHHDFDILIPALNIPRIKKIYPSLSYKRKWAGFAIAETRYNFENDQEEYRLIVQRIGEKQDEYEYKYKSFLTTSKKEARTLICENYDKRWSVEEFFRFENELGISRASTFNLNIRYGKLALALIAQAPTYQLRKKMNEDYQKWDAKHLANEILAWSDGDIRAKGDTIIVTFYGAPKHINPSDYVNLPTKLSGEGVNPRIPWLFDYKLDFRFK